MVFSRMARKYLIRVCTCNVGERPVSLPSSVLSLFGVSYTLLSAPMALAFFAAPFSHGLKALVHPSDAQYLHDASAAPVSLRFASWPRLACSVKLLSMFSGFLYL